MKAVYAQLGLALNAAAAALPAAAITKTSYSTQYITVTSCGPSVTNCPPQSTVVSTIVRPATTPAPAPAPSACVTSLFDGCNPARSSCTNGVGTFVTVTPSTYPTSYFIGCNPARTSCSNGVGVFVTLTSAPSVCASSTGGAPTPAPTSSSSAYLCNPAHSYPGGVTCDATARTLIYPSTTAPAASASACVTSLFDGCNPARSSCTNGVGTFVTVTPSTYPTSYFIGCNPARTSCSNGVGVFVTLTSAPSVCASSTGGATTPAPTASSSAYLCNPAHSYPGGVTCDATARTLIYPSTSAPATTAPAASASACVTSLFDGCNPARSSCSNGVGTFVTVTPSTYPTSYFIGCNPARTSCSNGVGTFVTLSSAPSVCASSTAAPTTTAPAKNTNTAPAPAPPASKASSAVSGTVCQTKLTGAYETPHLIVPIDSKNPDKAYGTQYNAYLSSEKSTIFNFDIPYSATGKTCTVLFLFPEQKNLETSSFTQSGSGGLTFSQLSSPADQGTTFKNAPAVAKELAKIDGVKPGNSYVVASGPCAPGTKQGIKVSSTGGYALEYFQDWNPSPIGLFVTVC